MCILSFNVDGIKRLSLNSDILALINFVCVMIKDTNNNNNNRTMIGVTIIHFKHSIK